jgi:uridylate kinase
VKLSGEALMGDLEFGTDAETVDAIASQLKRVRDRGVEVSVVTGGGNIYRGLQGAAAGMDRATADYMGMLAIVLNALTLQDALEKQGVHTRVLSALTISEVAEPYNPFFSSDTAAALRALEMHSEIILMAKNGVEGVYTADPKHDPNAEFIPEITAREALQRGLKVMDSTALSLCMDNHLPINVFNMNDESNIDRIVSGERVGTLVKPE